MRGKLIIISLNTRAISKWIEKDKGIGISTFPGLRAVLLRVSPILLLYCIEKILWTRYMCVDLSINGSPSFQCKNILVKFHFN